MMQNNVVIEIMESSHKKIALTICTVAILVAVIFYAVSDRSDDYRIPVNDGLTSVIDFDVNCSETGTSTEGTFFVVQSNSSVNIKIVADLTVGETDKNGIELFIPAEFDIVSILCSFRGDTSSEYVLAREWPEGGYYIEIAQVRSWIDVPIGGGEGMLIIELQSNKSVKLSDVDSLNFMVAAGLKVERIDILILH